MRDYKEYAAKVAEEIMDTTELEARVTEKDMPDGTKRYGIAIKETSAAIAPTVYVEQLADENLPINIAAEEVINLYEQHKPTDMDISFFTEYENIKDKLYARLMPKTFKADVFRSAKSKGFEDLILVPYVEITMSDGTSGGIKVQAEHIEKWGVTKRAVIDQSIRNLKKSMKLTSLFDMMLQMVPGFNDGELPPESRQVIVSNDKGIFGAAAVIAAQDELKERFPEGYYVLPSSVHEVIVSPATDNPDEEEILSQMVQDVNRTTVQSEEQLSNHVYKIA